MTSDWEQRDQSEYIKMLLLREISVFTEKSWKDMQPTKLYQVKNKFRAGLPQFCSSLSSSFFSLCQQKETKNNNKNKTRKASTRRNTA